jgi:glucokinase
MASPFRPPEGDEWKAEIETARTAAEVPAYVKELRSAVRSVRPRGCLATVVSLPGVVDEASAKVYLSANLRWLEKVSVRGVLKEAGVCGAAAGRVLYVQEIRALAVGHLLRVAGGQTDAGGGDFLLVDVGSGVGAAAVVGGRLYSGALPLSGEVGHTPVLGNGRRCGCGGLGCLETLVSRGGLLASARAEKRGMNWAEVVERLAEGPLPGWLRQSLSASAAAIASALNVMGLRHVVITGLLNELPESAREFLSNKIRAASMWARFGSIKIEYAPRQRAAGLVVLGVEAALAGM